MITKFPLSTEGNLWVAVLESSRVMIFSPEGECLKEISFPAAYVTCPTWGGKDHDIIYLSTGKDRRANSDPVDGGGHMYMYKPAGSKGQPKHNFGS